MTNEELLTKLYEIGKLPSDRDSGSDNFPFNKLVSYYSELLVVN